MSGLKREEALVTGAVEQCMTGFTIGTPIKAYEMSWVM